MNAKFKLLCDGRGTYIELDGKTMGRGIKRVKFEQDVSDCNPTVDIQIDLKDFRFMPDGKFDEVEKTVAETKPPEHEFERLV